MTTRIMTGLKPTGSGELHLGNYIGALRPLVNFAREAEHEVYLMIADYHTLINIHDAEQMRANVERVAAAMLALMHDLPHVHIYRQSAIPEITELNFILSCFSSKGLMNRAHAYKALIDKNQELGRTDLDQGINMGLFTYPILMAADILIFQPDLVPVGKDQHQHLEIARDICQTFNHKLKAEIQLPQTFTPEGAGVLPGIDGQKMSKSYNNTIPIFCEEKRLKKLINKIKTDSKGMDEPKDTAGSILFETFCQFSTSEQQHALAARFASGAGYGEIKQAVFEAVNTEISPLREIYQHWLQQPQALLEKLQQHEESIRPTASQNLQIIKQKCGL